MKNPSPTVYSGFRHFEIHFSFSVYNASLNSHTKDLNLANSRKESLERVYKKGSRQLFEEKNGRRLVLTPLTPFSSFSSDFDQIFGDFFRF